MSQDNPTDSDNIKRFKRRVNESPILKVGEVPPVIQFLTDVIDGKDIYGYEKIVIKKGNK